MGAPASSHDARDRQRNQRAPTNLTHPKPSRHATRQLKNSANRALPGQLRPPPARQPTFEAQSNREPRLITRSRLASSAASVIARNREVASYRAATASNVVSDQHAHASADPGHRSSNPAIEMDSTKARRRYARPHHGTEMSASATSPLLPPESSTRVRQDQAIASDRPIDKIVADRHPARCTITTLPLWSTGPAPAAVQANFVR